LGRALLRRRCLAAPRLALRPGCRPFLAQAYAQALDAPRVGVEHMNLVIAGTGNDFAAHRQPADMADQIAAQRLDFLAGLAGDEILADHGTDVIKAGARVGNKDVVGLPYDRGRLVAVMLVVDLADDLLDNVLDRD